MSEYSIPNQCVSCAIQCDFKDRYDSAEERKQHLFDLGLSIMAEDPTAPIAGEDQAPAVAALLEDMQSVVAKKSRQLSAAIEELDAMQSNTLALGQAAAAACTGRVRFGVEEGNREYLFIVCGSTDPQFAPLRARLPAFAWIVEKQPE